MRCSDIASAMERLSQCREDRSGVRVSTTCLYPSFEVVWVFVSRVGDDTFIVHDFGEAYAIAISHGRQPTTTTSFLVQEASRYGLTLTDNRLSLKVDSLDWLPSAVLSIANAASNACNRAVGKEVQVRESDLRAQIYDRLRIVLPEAEIIQPYRARGSSGRRYEVDVAAMQRGRIQLFGGVSPHPVSINSKYAAFADIGRSDSTNWSVHAQSLSDEDSALLGTVSAVVPLSALDRVEAG